MKENVNTNKPLVSIIMAAYNAEDYIAEAISSVLEQTYQNWELIIVNDGSTDGTGHIIESFMQGDERVLVLNQKNSGRPAIARNAGIKFLKGDYVTFLDADDTYEKGKLFAQINVLNKHPKVSLAFHDIGIMDENGLKEKKSYLEDIDYMKRVTPFVELLEGDAYLGNNKFYNFMSTTITAIHMSSVIVSCSALFKQKVWFEEDFIIGEDIDLWFRLVKDNEVIFVNQVLSNYRRHESSITQDDERLLIGSIYSHTRNLERGSGMFSVEETEVYSKRIAQNHLHLAHLYFEKNSMKKARKHLAEARNLTKSVPTLLPFLKTWIPFSIIKICKNK